MIQGIADKLNIEDEVEVTPLEINVEDPNFFDSADQDMLDDYKFIRRKLRYSTAACEAVLESALKNMAEQPGARAVEGCAAIIKTITECTNQLLGLHEKRKKICNIAEPQIKENDEDEYGENGVTCKIDEIIESFNKKK